MAIKISKISANKVAASAPSNIALIKYMGLSDVKNKIPANTSLSYTLTNIRTNVVAEKSATDKVLTPVGAARFLQFMQVLKQKLSLTDSFLVTSQNNFPTGCGLASSAASFAALTASLASFADQTDIAEIAALSRLGSGSACRSFFPNWVEWSGTCVRNIALPFSDLMHSVILLDKSPKKISSSTAHKLVTENPNFTHRIANASNRLISLKAAINSRDWSQAREIIRAEYLEMHNLFTTSNPAFSYRTAAVKAMEYWLDEYCKSNSSGPWYTLDAGPNIHLLFADKEQQQQFLSEFKRSHANVEII